VSVDAALRALLAAELVPVLEEQRALRAEVAELRAASKPPELEMLGRILGCSHRAALGRAERDAQLRGLGVRLGRRLLYRRAEVMALLAARTRGEH
jgi:hypothetical protein